MEPHECSDTTPICTPAACIGVRQVAAGNAHTCAVLTDATVRCWGRNNTGQLGDGSTVNRSFPVPVKGLADVATIALGGGDDDGFSCAVHADGTVSCWGKNSWKMLGTSTTESCGKDQIPCSRTPLLVPALKNVAAVSASVEDACALHHDGTVSCWGYEAEVAKVEGLSGVLEIATGVLQTCARTATDVLCWGGNTSGQCGQDPSAMPSVPAPTVVHGVVGAQRLAAGYYHTCAIADGHQIHCWGNNQCGQLGDGSSCGSSCGTPYTKCGSWTSLLPSITDPPVEIGGGAYHTCAMAAGRLYCWGRNDFGQVSITSGSTLGMGDPYVALPVPTPVQHATSLTVGPYHECAMLETGGVRCMGRNDYGQLGSGTTDSGPAVSVVWSDPMVRSR